MRFNETGYEVIDVSDASKPLLGSFDELALDEFCPSRSRFRRFAQFHLTPGDHGWTVTRLPHRPFIQQVDYNKLVGGVKRDFPPVLVDLEPLIRTAAHALGIDRSKEWQVNCHQIRIVTNDRIVGTPVPEGPHCDGFDYLMIACLSRDKVEGGVTELMPPGGGKPFFAATLQPGQAILIDDGRMFHNTTDLSPVGSAEGHRDIVIVAFLDWARKKYGPAHEMEIPAHA